MCKPTYFDVIHKGLNVHMNLATKLNKEIAYTQYNNLCMILQNLGINIKFIEPQENLVDMVFAANGALVNKRSNLSIVSHFKAIPRQPETHHWTKFLHNNGHTIFNLKNYFEGQGDALFSHNYKILWGGYGQRSKKESYIELSSILPDVKIYPLELVDPFFYHLDTCFCIIKDIVMYYPNAFSNESIEYIESEFQHSIKVSEADAKNFACNAFNYDNFLVLHKASDLLKSQLDEYNIKVIENNMSEFLLSGGSVKCCILS